MIPELNWFTLGNYKNTGATIGYRRVSGKLGLTSKENGVRGAWVEKRQALFRNLIAKNYRIFCFTEGTDETKASGYKSHNTYVNCDCLFLEFGGTNLQFYGAAWQQTIKLIQQHRGKIVFLCDDPDLPFLWKLLPNENWSRWIIAANATNPKEVATILKCPVGCKVIDMPMSANVTFADYHEGQIAKAIYIGRPNGRGKYFNEFAKCEDLQIAGKAKEWIAYPNVHVKDNPQQKHRRHFYRQYQACLAVYDEKHKNCGWRTGRAYHALYAGIPVISPKGNDGLSWTYPIQNASDITNFIKMSALQKQEIWSKQKTAVQCINFVDPFTA